MNFCDTFDIIPEQIKKHFTSSNMFFTKEYENNVNLRGQTLIYIWSDCHVLVARVKHKLFIKAAILESEPLMIREGEDEKLFLDNAMQLLKDNGVQWTICSTTARFQNYPTGSKVAPCGNYIVDLTITEDLLWQNVHSKHRNSIRRGEKGGIELKFGGQELLKEYVPIANETYERSGVSDGDISYYNGLISGLDHNSKIILAYKDGVVQSGGMFYFNNSMAYYLHGASINRPEPGASNYLLWKSMLYFKEKGVRNFSFVGYHYNPEPGSKLEGIQRFKERFGGKLERSFNFRYEQRPIIYKMYCIAMSLKNKCRYHDAIDLQINDYPEFNGGENN